MAPSGSLQNTSNDRDGKIDLTSTYGLKTKAERRKYLSPVSKRRKFVGDNFQTKIMVSCSTKEKACRQKMATKNSLTNDGSNEKMSGEIREQAI
jgi:hypothetical protein